MDGGRSECREKNSWSRSFLMNRLSCRALSLSLSPFHPSPCSPSLSSSLPPSPRCLPFSPLSLLHLLDLGFQPTRRTPFSVTLFISFDAPVYLISAAPPPRCCLPLPTPCTPGSSLPCLVPLKPLYLLNPAVSGSDIHFHCRTGLCTTQTHTHREIITRVWLWIYEQIKCLRVKA